MTIACRSEPALRINLAIMAQQRWWVAGAAISGLALGIAIAFAQGKQYSATAQILVQPASMPAVPGSTEAAVTPAEVQTEQQLVTSGPVRTAVRRMLGSTPAVSASQIGQTNVIGITATSRNPAMAARIANDYAQAFVAYRQHVALRNLWAAEGQLRSQISSLSSQIRSLHRSSLTPQAAALANQEAVLKEQLAQLEVSGAVRTGDVELVTPATPPVRPSSPGAVTDGALGLAAGLLLGGVAGYLRHTLNDSLTSKDAVEQLASSPVVAMVPAVVSWRKRGQAVLVSRSEPTSPAAEAYRSLRTSLQFARQERGFRTLLVTSPSPAEGKTSTACNLGTVFAQAGERVLLVSCDLRSPRLGQFFGLDEQEGLTTVLLGQKTIAQVLQQVPAERDLWVLAAGALPPSPAELLNGAAARSLFADLREQFDLVIIDSPPVLPVTDAVLLSTFTEGTLLVVAAGRTRRSHLRRAAEKLAQVNAPVIGAVLNEVTKQDGYGYGYEYRYAGAAYPAAVPGLVAPHANGRPGSEAPVDTR
jgi:succinoglycan biosynthesis transport protein ExoP